MNAPEIATLSWFNYCVGVYACGAKYLKSLGEQKPEFLALLEKADTVIDTTFQGDAKLFFSELSTDLNNSLRIMPDKEVIELIEEWLNGFF